MSLRRYIFNVFQSRIQCVIKQRMTSLIRGKDKFMYVPTGFRWREKKKRVSANDIVRIKISALARHFPSSWSTFLKRCSCFHHFPPSSRKTDFTFPETNSLLPGYFKLIYTLSMYYAI